MGKRSRKCENWESLWHACGREGFSIKNIKRDTFICFNHFIGCCGPTEEDPDPFLATLTDKELGNERTRKRKPPKQRELIPPKAKKRKSENMTPNVESTDTFESTDTNDIVLENSVDYVGIMSITYIDFSIRRNIMMLWQILKSMYVTSPLRQNLISKQFMVALATSCWKVNAIWWKILKIFQCIYTYRSQNSMDINVILKSEKNTKYILLG